eukprot:SM000007S20884  [mRNA]  locus=s7:721931:724678:- [translate_table: standard]
MAAAAATAAAAAELCGAAAAMVAVRLIEAGPAGTMCSAGRGCGGAACAAAKEGTGRWRDSSRKRRQAGSGGGGRGSSGGGGDGRSGSSRGRGRGGGRGGGGRTGREDSRAGSGSGGGGGARRSTATAAPGASSNGAGRPGSCGAAKRALISGPLPLLSEAVLQAEEIIGSPLWTTFLSSAAGVWCGAGACFSPTTACMEPLSLGATGEYLYDAATRAVVDHSDAAAGSQGSLTRRVTWVVSNPLGEAGVGSGATTRQNGDAASGSEGEDGHWEQNIGSEDGMLEVAGALWREDDECDETNEESQWRVMQQRGQDTAAGSWEERGREVAATAVAAVGTKHTAAQVTSSLLAVTEVAEVMENEVMEEDVMSREDGLVYFEDGSYSRGPAELLPTDKSSGAGGEEDGDVRYHALPTYKIEQCLVQGGHTRLRLVHTLGVEAGGEEVQVLRVAAYEEVWLGPCRMEAISKGNSQGGSADVGRPPFSQRPRPQLGDVAGSWKVFEVIGTALHHNSSGSGSSGDGSQANRQAADLPVEVLLKEAAARDNGGAGLSNSKAREPVPPSILYSCQETAIERSVPGQAGPDGDDDASVLWLPGGVTASVEVGDDGGLTLGLGWLCGSGMRLSMRRRYDSAGLLAEVRCASEVKDGWVGGRM